MASRRPAGVRDLVPGHRAWHLRPPAGLARPGRGTRLSLVRASTRPCPSLGAGARRIAALPWPDRRLPPGAVGAPGAAGRLRGVLRGKAGGAPPGACCAGPAVARPGACGGGGSPARAGSAAGPATRAGHQELARLGARHSGVRHPGARHPGTGQPDAGQHAAREPETSQPDASHDAGGQRTAGHARPVSRAPVSRRRVDRGRVDRGRVDRGRVDRGRVNHGGLNVGRAAAASMWPVAETAGQPSSRRCLPLCAAGPLGRGAAFGRARDRAPARPGQMDRRTRSKSRSRMSVLPYSRDRVPGVRGKGMTKHY